jgi:hypothetical protein
MLFYQTIDTKTLGILKKLQSAPEFSGLRLVGGTGLALQIGHRKSIDIDLFGPVQSDSLSISKKLDTIGKTTIIKDSENIHIFSIGSVKLDIVNYHYPWLEKAICEDALTLAGEKDIAAMKLAAITNRGSKKDFIDLFFLLKKFTLGELLDFYKKKFHDGSSFLVLKSLSYFDDADDDENPIMIKDVNWDTVKEFMKISLNKYISKT